MLVFLPVFSFLSLFIYLGQVRPTWGWRLSFLRSTVFLGVYGILSVEVLSLLDAVTQIVLTIIWSIPLVGLSIALGVLWRRDKVLRLPIIRFPEDLFERISIIGIILILLITALVAWLTPPQTWDSLNYHMSRVAHWAQNQSVKPFATGIEIQNSIPPGAELGFLHLYVLGGGDRYVNFVEWFAMLGCLVGVSLMAKEFGANRKGQIISVLFAATIPMGIVQASSTMTDYVVALWVVCVAVEILGLQPKRSIVVEVVAMSAAAGLAILTKPIAYAYLLPLAIYAVFRIIRISKLKMLLGASVLAVSLVGILNIGHFGRMIYTYGSVFPKDQITRHSNQMKDLRGLTSNVLRNIGLHVGTPSPHINKGMFIVIEKIHDWIGIDLNDPRTTSFGTFKVKMPTTNEVTIGNPLHSWIILGFFIMLVVGRWKSLQPEIVVFSLLVLSTFFIYSFVFKWQIFGSRFHLPFFILMAPVIGTSFTQVLPVRVVNIAGICLLLFSWPWLMSIQSRPLIPDSESRMGSILIESRDDLYFGNGPNYQYPYVWVTERIRDSECASVGLALAGNAAEYPFWVLMGSPLEDVRLEWIVSGTPSARLAPADFQPCAVICDGSCPKEWEIVNGLPLSLELAGYRLFLETE